MCIIRNHAPRIKCKNLEKLIAKNDSLTKYNQPNQNEIAQYVYNRLDHGDTADTHQVYQYNGDELSLPVPEIAELNPHSQELPAIEEGNEKKSKKDRLEYSKVAARNRRGQESFQFEELRQVLPIAGAVNRSQVDLVTLLRITTTLFRLRECPLTRTELYLPNGHGQMPIWNQDMLSESFCGWITLLDSDMTVLYVTESVSVYTGINQTDMVGFHLSEFMNECDFDELADGIRQNSFVSRNVGREFAKTLRVKSLISPRGRIVTLKQAFEKAAFCNYRILSSQNGNKVTVAFWTSVPVGKGTNTFTDSPATLCDINRLTTNQRRSGLVNFATRHTLEMQITYVSEKIDFLNVNKKDLTGISYYELIYPADVLVFVNAINDLFTKSNCQTPYYRLIGRDNTVIWLQTEATTVNFTSKGRKDKYILCAHSVIGIQSEFDSLSTPFIFDYSAQAPVPSIDDVVLATSMRPMMSPENMCCSLPSPLHEFFEPIEQKQVYGEYNDTESGRSVNEAVCYNSGKVLDWLYNGDEQSMPQPSQHSSIEDLKTLVSIASKELQTDSQSSFSSHNGQQTITTLSRRSSSGGYDRNCNYSDSGMSSPFIAERSRQNSNGSTNDEFDIVNYLSDEQPPRSIDCNAYRHDDSFDTDESRSNVSESGPGHNSVTPTFDLFEELGLLGPENTFNNCKYLYSPLEVGAELGSDELMFPTDGFGMRFDLIDGHHPCQSAGNNSLPPIHQDADVESSW